MTDWEDVTPGTTHYKKDKLGQLYSGFKGGLVAGALTIAGVAFYAGYMGTVHGPTSWEDVDSTSTTWHDV